MHAEYELDRGERVVVEQTLTMHVGPGGEPTLIRLEGELDIASAAALEREIRNAEEASPRSLIVDLSGLYFVDSTGLAVLIHAARRAADNGTRLGLLRGKGHVQRVLELTGLGDALPFLD